MSSGSAPRIRRRLTSESRPRRWRGSGVTGAPSCRLGERCWLCCHDAESGGIGAAPVRNSRTVAGTAQTMTEKTKIPSILAGVAGEYLVAGELSRRGWIASLTLRNTRGVDILASNSELTRSVGIQVKTSQLPRPAWLLNQRAESLADEHYYYVFVRLNGFGQPKFYIVPSQVVAEYTRRTHQEWLRQPGRDGRPHKDNPNRSFEDEGDQYLDRWDLLNL